MSIFTSRTAITAGAVAVAVVLSIGGVAVAQASIGQFDDTTPTNSPTGVPSPNPTMSDDGPLHDLGDDHGGDRPDGVSAHERFARHLRVPTRKAPPEGGAFLVRARRGT